MLIALFCLVGNKLILPAVELAVGRLLGAGGDVVTCHILEQGESDRNGMWSELRGSLGPGGNGTHQTVRLPVLLWLSVLHLQ